jgi:hypothetical protein
LSPLVHLEIPFSAIHKEDKFVEFALPFSYVLQHD